ncbi:ribose-5-phosphate isomerase RpiA [Achromobacter xylosoxidans]|jgi:ribose 5-phosphate isomerase A|uniref:Ribose-5-phosphate isomerase A n=1 Tax=Alcaligenes xylosoxydans xylosoxydans TaxID=85698 RepID=A0A9X3R858_ALCXX|nr:ribose-5-phosphate isomerase RpiA [Achromobacter xylosoxidans]AMH06585.1 ribose-5-phosphate isomerase RpiA [Achromobacter xylosoxidans]AXA76597.1 ribose-5-phosphate isomerase RpiA [Achromobacter xylosoxidans]KOQ18361.1 ribose 5-phosphate isomerase [Achromobacter xylosoxidans]KOQ20070.1 ribose 5-phosphate isomerase [Achromobacter xylosoxidans]KOQ26037.1 ribose 5-phosphate isomerase [Achromobacter xylosoxidans]
MLSQQELKQQAADAALELVEQVAGPDVIIGVGTGSTADLFIDGLARFKGRIGGTVASSERSAARLAGHGLKVLDLNDVTSMPIYVDGADEIDANLHMIKGGGGAQTREKIVASVADRFVCIVDESKLVEVMGKFPLPIEVIPMAREAVARAMTAMGGQPRLREGFVTDNGNIILDVAGLSITDAPGLEARVNNLPGVVTCGLFAIAGADVALLATQNGIRRLDRRA